MRTRVHEYGGGAFIVSRARAVIFSNFADQRLYRQDDGGEPRADHARADDAGRRSAMPTAASPPTDGC